MTVHSLEPKPGTVHGVFSRDIAPALTIDPGDTVVFRTLDAGWGSMGAELFGESVPDVGKDPERDRGHALTGPVAVRGALPGHVLEIHINAILPGQWGWTWAGPMENGERHYTHLTDEAFIGWRLDPSRGRATDIHDLGLSIPLGPFMGVMGNAPAERGEHSTAPPRRVGGNLDCRELVASSILWLPVEVEEALFSVGDGHGAQGNGEIGSTAIECPMERVELMFVLRRDLTLDNPRALTPKGPVTMGFGATLDDAAEAAIGGMLDLLESRMGSRARAAALASVAVDLEVTQVVNGAVGVHALLRADHFRAPEPTSG